MLMMSWAQLLTREKGTDILMAGIGRPSYPIPTQPIKSILSYWHNLLDKAENARVSIASDNIEDPDIQSELYHHNAVINYNDPSGCYLARKKAAAALDQWYGNMLGITAENILFTSGGAGGLYCIFDVINNRFPGGRILTTLPYYPLYKGSRDRNNLFPIDIITNKLFSLTPDILEESIQSAYNLAKKDGSYPSAIVLCNPNNPLGTAFSEKEASGIVNVLKKYPDILIILDEAYAEMIFDQSLPRSLICVAPELKKRTILLRSATKALSAAGERMAITISFDKELMQELLSINVDVCCHPPISLQHMYAEALAHLDFDDLQMSARFYQSQVKYALQRLKSMNISLCHDTYEVKGTFYVIANLNELIGCQMSSEIARAIKKQTAHEPEIKQMIECDEDIAYSLLFENHIMITPCSYLGIDPTLGYVRITCSAGLNNIEKIMDIIEQRLSAVRKLRA